MHKPISTYRIQFNKDFNFTDFEGIIPYLHKLGVDTIYASPIFKAIPGSMHGYDGVDPTCIHPEIGDEKQLLKISKQLKQLGMHWIQDIVPNHMAFHPDNNWLMDVLKNGMRSPYYKYFDIGLPLDNLNEQLMLPFLENSLTDTILKKELHIVLSEGEFSIQNNNSKWPLNLKAYALIFKRAKEKKVIPNVVEKWIENCVYADKQNNTEYTNALKNELKNEEFEKAFHHLLAQINNDADLMMEILNDQYYRLCNWQETDKKINYRRFFTVNGLICLNIHDQDVFQSYHKYLFKLIDKGIISGLRIDHIDGLFDPKLYLQNLRKTVGEHIYIVAEKILQHNEQLPIEWPIQGNTGYDYLSMVNNLLTNKGAERSFNKVYEHVTGKRNKVEDLIAKKKTDILYQHMAGELENLHQLFILLELATAEEINNVSKDSLKEAIGAFLIYCPVYRFYGNAFPLGNKERSMVKSIFNSIPKKTKLQAALKLIKKAILVKPSKNKLYADKACLFYQRCMQFTGPLTAKGVEDTLMYTYNRFIGHDEVGDSPDYFGLSVQEFHKLMKIRQQNWPLSLNGTSTHDTKRGEDVRARLNVLTDISSTWSNWVKKFEKISANFRELIDDFKDLHQNDLYLIYQTLIGIWPMPHENDARLGERITTYLEKALREAKKRSSWTLPNEDYEEIVKLFALSFLNFAQKDNSPIKWLSEEISDFGIINSLAQLILKLTCPGVPDFYQGSELWDLSLVDPDNRKPVDYQLRSQFLDEIPKLYIDDVWQQRYNGKIKLWFTTIGLKHRKEFRGIYEEGDYLPLKAKGAHAKHLIAYARKSANNWIITVVPLGMAAICNHDSSKIKNFNWEDTRIEIPANAPSNWENIFTEIKISKDVTSASLFASELFKKLPFAILTSHRAGRNRGAGIGMHISSLPSPFGIGDIGPASYSFIDFLVKAKQKYWQILPLNPISKEQCYSPYNSQSSMAGNVLLISPESLMQDGLISATDLQNYRRLDKNEIVYEDVEKAKNEILSIAYSNFLKNSDDNLVNDFAIFCEQEASWLTNYVLYLAIKQNQNQLSWDQWPNDLKTRKPNALGQIFSKYRYFIEEQKWRQFIFHRQWNTLRAYALKNGVQFIGDLPFYIAFDSVDVWVNPNLFKLTDNYKMEYSAGVPPDYFNAQGQLWGMPIYDWKCHKNDAYRWWIQRIKKNRTFFDLLRLDHFRAFESFWQVPADAESAINGTWEPGPGEDFFKALKKEFNDLPFIAEDLGEIDEAVAVLRQQFGLPGMKVIQFAFGDQMINSPHIPHNFDSENFIVYSGTHDNNTTKGWFEQDASDLAKKRLNTYTGKKVNVKNAHYVIAQMAYSSVAQICILPIQDILGLDADARINTPSSITKNWIWKLKQNQLNGTVQDWLIKQTEMYGRD